MADQDLTELTENESPALEDLIYSVDDPSGTPLDRKVTLQNVMELAPHLVDRGDVSDTYDFVVGDLTTNGAWNDLDLSSIVPAGATFVLIRVSVQDGDVGSMVSFRKNGYSGDYMKMPTRVQAADKYNDSECVIPCDSGRVIEYNATNTTFSQINITVLAWWIDTVT